jgi:uncharacterized protein (TIGR02118 family)
MKVFWFQRTTIPEERFREQWELASSSWTPPAGVRRWIRSMRVDSTDPLVLASDLIAVEEFWCDRNATRAVRRAIADPRGGLAAAFAGLIDPKRSFAVTCSEIVAMDGPFVVDQTIRQIFMYRHRQGMTRQQSLDYWLTQHASLVRESPGISRYVQNVVELEPDGTTGPLDGVGETCFPDEAAANTFHNSTEYLKEQVELDGPKFVDMSSVLAIRIGKQTDVPLGN